MGFTALPVIIICCADSVRCETENYFHFGGGAVIESILYRWVGLYIIYYYKLSVCAIASCSIIVGDGDGVGTVEDR